MLAPLPQRVLVKEVNWLGDVVMSLPALRAVRRALPQAHLAVLVKRQLHYHCLQQIAAEEVVTSLRDLGTFA
jgi:heptosyltransferase-2